MKKALRLSAILSAALALTACGGGGDASGGFAAGGYVPPSTSAPPASAPAEPAPKPAHIPPELAPAFSVLLYGDSIMAGNGTAETPAMTLQRLRPKLTVTDRAVAGTSLAMLALTWQASDRAGSRVVVIENGVIDSWQGTRRELFLQTVRSMIFALRAEGRIPVLTGFSRQVPGFFLGQPQLAGREDLDRGLADLAAELAVPFADWGSVEFNGSIDLLDGIHPGKAYSDRLVERLAATLDGVQP